MTRIFPEWLIIGALAIASGCFVALPMPEFIHARAAMDLQKTARLVLSGHLTGSFHGRNCHIPSSGLQMGDVILFHNGGGAYGYWTHAVFYVGKQMVIDADDFRKGTICIPLKDLPSYDDVGVYRVTTTPRIRELAAKTALSMVGTPYDLLSRPTDRHSEYCSKLIWQVYKHHGVILCPARLWILPDDLAKGERMKRVLK